MKKIKIKNNCPWAQVPEALITDQNLAHAAVRLAAWLCGRPDGWEVGKKHAKKECCLGEYAWDTACKQLETAGYLKRVQHRARGRFDAWEYIFDPQPGASTGGGFSAPGPTAPGSPGGGEPAHITRTSKKEQVKQEQPPPQEEIGGGGEELEIPPCLKGQEPAALKLLDGVPTAVRQQLLDELAGSAGVRAPLSWLRSLAAKLRSGDVLVFERAGGVADARRARVAHKNRLDQLTHGTDRGALPGKREPVAPPSDVVAAERAKLRAKRAEWSSQ